MDDNDYMKIANAQAKKALARGDYPAGCVIIKNARIIARASSRGISKKDATAHAEILAISKACKKTSSRILEGCVIYTNIEPCLMCAKAIVYARIKKVVYGAEHKEYGSKRTFDILKQNDIAKDIEIVSGLQKEIASELLNTFIKKNKF
ncbi:MAG: nucleoside deaminase [Nanoarchaeota archaeon]|nr:nucleoside deaminase [Nanoarchaeota archaeon]